MNPVNTSCPISLEPFNDSSRVTIIRHCRHIFNTDNLSNWFRTNCRCPVCRYDIRDYIQPVEHNNESINENNNETTENNNQSNENNNQTSENAQETNQPPVSNVNSTPSSSNNEANQIPANNNVNSSPLADFSFTFNTNEGFPPISDTQISSLITELFNNYRRQR